VFSDLNRCDRATVNADSDGIEDGSFLLWCDFFLAKNGMFAIVRLNR
jgi:hypothetical protein